MLLGLLSAYAEITYHILCKLKNQDFEVNLLQIQNKVYVQNQSLKNHTGHKTELTLCY